MSGFPLPHRLKENAGFQGSSYPPYQHRTAPSPSSASFLSRPIDSKYRVIMKDRLSSFRVKLLQFSDLRNTFDSKCLFPITGPRLYPPSPHSDPQCSMEQASTHIPRHRQSLCLSSSPFLSLRSIFTRPPGNDGTALPSSFPVRVRNALLSFLRKSIRIDFKIPSLLWAHITYSRSSCF